MLEKLKFSIGGMEGWTKVTVRVEKDIVYYVTDSLMEGVMHEKRLKKSDSKEFLQKVEDLQINKWKSKYQPPEAVMVCDGTQWELDYKETDKRCKHIYGDNTYPDDWGEFMEIMDMIYPFIDADSIQNVLVEFNISNSEHRGKINITRKTGVATYETSFGGGRGVFSTYIDKNGVREFLDELSYSEIPKANANDERIVSNNAKNIGRYKCVITYHAKEETVVEGIYDTDGIPENWESFINAIKDFLSEYEHRELFNLAHF